MFSSLLKLPQIYQVVHHRSGKRISLLSIAIEICVNAFSLGYNWMHSFPFSTYGECSFIFIQNIFLYIIVAKYKKRNRKKQTILFLIIVISYLTLVIAKVTPDWLASFLYSCCFALSIFQKLPQIIRMYQTKSKGDFSSLTAFLLLLGSTARLFTTWTEVHDLRVFSLSLIGFLLKVTTFIQSIIYSKFDKNNMICEA